MSTQTWFLPTLIVAAMTDLGLTGCDAPPPPEPNAPCEAPRFAEDRDSVQCGQIVDAEGRVVFLHGVNARVEGIFDVTFDDGRTALEPIPPFKDEDARRMREIGLNALRLPINWSALEPTEDGGFEEAYLDDIEAIVDLCAAHGVRVLIDFHQDAYSKEIGEDGAPLWAIVPPPDKLLGGPLEDLEQRRTSPQVLDAFATFFGASDEGAYLRDRFAAAVKRTAERFKDHPNVVGIEIYNEPVASDKEVHDMHDLVIPEMRKGDPGRLAFFEPSVLRNLKDTSPYADRPSWGGAVYAPHVYTLAFSGTDEEKQQMTKETLRKSNESARGEAGSWDAPLAVGEYGYDPNGIQAENYLVWQTELQDETLASGFLWVWKEESQGRWGLFDKDAVSGEWIERDPVRQAISRVVPEAVAGWPKSFGYDRANKRFQMAFSGEPTAKGPHRIFVPGASDFAASFEVTCDGVAVSATRDPETGLVEVICGADDGDHTLEIQAN